MAQQRSATALEPYLALAPSATSPRAASDLITQATSAPHAYSFAELLQKPNIQKLRSAEPENYRGYLRLLEIFAWGTWQDYTSTPDLPKLNTAQEEKLRLLSLLSLVSSNISSPSTPASTASATSSLSSSTTPCPSEPTLSYSALQAALNLPSPSALESLTTTAIHAETLFATLDPAAGVIAVRSVAPVRDLPPGSVPVIKTTTDAWITRCEDVVKELEGKVEDIMTKAKERARREANLERRLEMAVDKGDLKGTRGEDPVRMVMDATAELERERIGKIGRDSGIGGGGDGTDEMDIDDAGELAGSSVRVTPRANR